MPKKEKDWFKEFKGKTKLTEREVNLMKRRVSDKKINPSQMRKNKYALTRTHTNKGVAWLRKNKKSLNQRQLRIIGYIPRYKVGKTEFYKWASLKSTTIRLVGFKEQFYPVYRVSRGGQSFTYYVKFGRIHITR